MYRKMIIALDGTPKSLHAASQALVLASSEGSEVILLSVAPSYDGSLRMMGDKAVLSAMRKPYEDALEEAHALARKMGMEARRIFREGEPVEELLDIIEETGADCVAMGKTVGGYYTDLIPIGSFAAKIIKLSEIDILLVPENGQLHLDTILAPVDGSAPSCRATDKAVDLAVRYGAALSMLTVYELPLEAFAYNAAIDAKLHAKAEALLSPLLHKAEEAGVHRLKGQVKQGSPVYRVIADTAHEEKAGLVVMCTAGRGYVSRMLLGSVAEWVICSGVAPVLLIKKGLEQ